MTNRAGLGLLAVAILFAFLAGPCRGPDTPAPLAVGIARPFRATCPACKWDLTIYPPADLQAIDFARAKKTGTDEAPR
jgi:hypothetical protein